MHKSAAVGLALIIRQLAFRFDSLARKEHVYCTAARPDVLAVATPAMTREQWLGSYAVAHRSAAAPVIVIGCLLFSRDAHHLIRL